MLTFTCTLGQDALWAKSAWMALLAGPDHRRSIPVKTLDGLVQKRNFVPKAGSEAAGLGACQLSAREKMPAFKVVGALLAVDLNGAIINA